MLKLSKMTDYAVVVLSYMAEISPTHKTVGELALKTLLPEPTLTKVLKQLAKAGIVSSKRGAGGGYFIKKDKMAEISVWQIIEAIDGPIALTACVDIDTIDDCCIGGTCPLQGRWQKVNEAICNTLSNITLTDMQSSSVVGIGGRVKHGR